MKKNSNFQNQAKMYGIPEDLSSNEIRGKSPFVSSGQNTIVLLSCCLFIFKVLCRLVSGKF